MMDHESDDPSEDGFSDEEHRAQLLRGYLREARVALKFFDKGADPVDQAGLSELAEFESAWDELEAIDRASGDGRSQLLAEFDRRTPARIEGFVARLSMHLTDLESQRAKDLKNNSAGQLALRDASIAETRARLKGLSRELDAYRLPVVVESGARKPKRTDQLTSVIRAAKVKALDPLDPQSVWAQLVHMAQLPSRPPPLVGFVEGEGVQYRKDDADETLGYFNKEALFARLRRER